MQNAVVLSVQPGSIADEIGLEPGDALLSVDGQALEDILEYIFLTSSDEYTLEIQKKNGDVEFVEIENDDYEQLGVTFVNGLLDKPKVCRNGCVFCFVDQLPKGMRKALYFKDDDYRLSALMGNYITLTNLSEADIERIIRLRLPRINVSVHAADCSLRNRLIHVSDFDVIPIMERFAKAGILMNCQVVLCPGWNDGTALDETVQTLARMHPTVQSLSVVPVGLTKHREGLPSLQMVDAKGAAAVIEQIKAHQAQCLKRLGTRFVFASDEFYVKAGIDVPAFESYEEFLQLENGVGLIASLTHEFNAALLEAKLPDNFPRQTLVTGVSAAPIIQRLVEQVTDRTTVVAIQNDFFGHTITVAGLLTGQDIIAQLKGRNLGQRVLLPSVLLNADGLLLDDLTIADLSQALGVAVTVVEMDGGALLRSLIEQA